MRKILLTGVAAALTLGLSACDFNVNGKADAAPGSTASAPGNGAPSSGAPTRSHQPTGPGTGSGRAPSSSPGNEDDSPIRQGARQLKSKWGPLRYLASGKYTVGDTAFFTADDTLLVVAGSTCPNGTPSGPDMRCTVDGMDDWVQASPHNVTVYFRYGGIATKIQETQ
ncbi:hypothetical protein [Actinomadura gamaensis]|uniref:Lipoprotein n=1 Tax=Actinomadura gamaensis TaxID=1763541 RepID=A0ABV9U6G6_9ACTN